MASLSKLLLGCLSTPACQIDLHSLTSTVNQDPDDVAPISLIHDLMLRPCGDEGEIARRKFVTPRLLFFTGRRLALDVCSDGLDRVNSRASEKNPVTSSGVDYSV